MVRIRVVVAARQRLWLLLGVVAMALSLLAMHHLSSNHTAAGPPAGPSSVAAAHLMSASHTDRHQLDTVGADHAQLTALTGGGHPLSEVGECPGCADHSALELTCLAALVLLMSGFILIRPLAGRGLWMRPPVPLRVFVESRAWLLRPRTLVELAVSRT